MRDAGSSHPDLSVIILTYNEEENLPECLRSVEPLDCQVFVVDSGSEDRTKEIAKGAGAAVYEHPYENYAKQRNWALENLPIETEWVLNLDADERLIPDLVEEIQEALGDPPPVDGFLLRQRTVFMGRWMKHGGHYPTYHMRLFRHGEGYCEDRLYDQHFVVEGPKGRLEADYIDTTGSDLLEWSSRHVRWADFEATEIMGGYHGENRIEPEATGQPQERRRWLREGIYGRFPLFLRAFLYWIYRYFLRLGFLDGKEGLVFHTLQGFWFRFLVDARIWELEREASRADIEASPCQTSQSKVERDSR